MGSPYQLISHSWRSFCSEIVVRPIPMDGRVELKDDGFSITLSARSNKRRRRFTLAHELSHILLADGNNEFVAYRRSSTTQEDVERLCDSIAASLLMPRRWAESVSVRAESVEQLDRAARSAEVSTTATFLRLRDVREWTTSLICLRQLSKEHWRTSILYRPHGEFGAWPHVPAKTARSLDRLVARGINMEWSGELDLWTRGRHEVFLGRGRTAPRSMLLLGKFW